MQPSVSVVIPVLNEERFLAQSVTAILNQNYDGQIEVILALGPSIDNTNQVAQDLAKDNRVKLIQNPTGKTAAALNNAIKNSKFEISRFKGLGEMMPAQLKETTMNKESRNLIKVSVPTDKAKYKITSKLVNDLMGKESDLRLKFISENAGSSLNLDI